MPDTETDTTTRLYDAALLILFITGITAAALILAPVFIL